MYCNRLNGLLLLLSLCHLSCVQPEPVPVAVSKWTLNSPRDCMLRGCNTNDDCSTYAYSIRCLEEDIPMWAANLSTIACCFRCCLQHWSKKFSVAAGRREPAEMLDWLSRGGILLSMGTPLELEQIGEEWNMAHKTRLDKAYHSVPFPRFQTYSTLAEAKRVLESAQYPLAAHVSDLATSTAISIIGHLSLQNERLVRWVLPDYSPALNQRVCARNELCSAKVTFLPVGITNISDTFEQIGQTLISPLNRKALISCFFSLRTTADGNLGSSEIEKVKKRVESFTLSLLGSCTEMNGSQDSLNSFHTAVSASKFILYLQPEVMQLNFRDWMSIALVSGAIPIIIDPRQEVLTTIKANRLPVYIVPAVEELKKTEYLDNFLNEVLKHPDQQSISSVLLPYWFPKMVPITATLRHVHREQQYKEFLEGPIKDSILALSGPEVESTICEAPSTISASERLSIEIVIPRCCESASGDLSWMDAFGKVNLQSSIQISVYYKCPWCMPRSKVIEWADAIRNDSVLQEQVLSHGGITVLDDLHKNVRELMAFDRVINGKEATAYLSHITQRYDSLADVSIFMHSQPSHHMDNRLFERLFTYLKTCRHPLDFLSLNFRYFSGTWAHEPSFCLYKLIPALFQNSTVRLDDKRFPFRNSEEYTINSFHSLEMAGSTAAQFVTSREAIRRRSLQYWYYLMALNNGSINICGHETSERWGGDVTGAMERLWHNFFRTGLFISPAKHVLNASRYLDKPLVLPYRNEDPMLPAFLTVGPQAGHYGTLQSIPNSRMHKADRRKGPAINNNWVSSHSQAIHLTKKTKSKLVQF